jgi:hypothetical protein
VQGYDIPDEEIFFQIAFYAGAHDPEHFLLFHLPRLFDAPIPFPDPGMILEAAEAILYCSP